MRISDWSSDVCSSDLIAVFQQDLHAGLTRAGYPAAADPDQVDKVKVIAILCIFGLLATMVYGPLAALLVELFPARIRYSSLSLPYHIGNGWIGGFKIGRASCRERVGQYVLISVGA